VQVFLDMNSISFASFSMQVSIFKLLFNFSIGHYAIASQYSCKIIQCVLIWGLLYSVEKLHIVQGT